MAKEESFLDQVRRADVIYFRGGSSLKLLEILKKFSDLERGFEGKIIGLDSAGMNAFGRAFYSKSGGGVSLGLGILPFKTMPHYTDQYKDVLNGIDPDTEILFLREYEYRVFYK